MPRGVRCKEYLHPENYMNPETGKAYPAVQHECPLVGRKRRRDPARAAEYQRVYHRQYYADNAVNIRAKARERWRRIRLEVLNHYSNGAMCCACCGENTIQFLAIDHVESDGNIHRRTVNRGGSSFLTWLQDNGYPSGYQVLCHNCNMAKGFYGACPHARSE